MDKTLTDQIGTLLRAGCKIEMTPVRSALGYLYAEIVITPPAPDTPRPIGEEIRALQSGQTVRLPLHMMMHTIYDLGHLPHILQTACSLFVRRRRTTA